MRNDHTIAVIIPVLNEETSIARVLKDIPAWVDDVIVVDNGSTDGTATVAAGCGARVVVEPQRGYGAACLRGMAALKDPDIVVFLDGDYSDHPEEMPLLVDPVIRGEVDFMVGSRVRGERERGALTPQAAFGNWLATRLIRLFWGIRYTDLGPFRAILYRTLRQLGMADRDYGWTVEMQIKAALHAVPADEVPVSYRRRVGVSKVAGTVRGVIGAGYKILGLIAVNALFGRPVLKTDLLTFFTRFPEPGVVKTRLIPALGPEGAADLQREMTRHSLAVVPPPMDSVDVQVRYTGGEPSDFRRWLGPDFLYAEQGPGDLGERIARALDEGFEQAYGKVVICGTDCPELGARHASEALQALDQKDLVIGPAEDGGFYLIGLNFEAAPEEMHDLFAGVGWGGPDVFVQTRANAERLGLSLALLEPLGDVDLPEDLHRWEAAKHARRLSIIIPTLNEADQIGGLLEALADLPDTEIIVVDGGSTDATQAIARARARVVESDPGRARQMNAGARAATGNILLFLHADCRPPRGFECTIRQVLHFPEVAVGAFAFAVAAPGLGFRAIEWAANLRSRWLGAPYGDQGLFLRRETWEALGGYPDLPIMEDYALVRTAARIGRIVTVNPAIESSPRRWHTGGLLRVTACNVAALLAYQAGVNPARIAAWRGRASGG